MSVTRKTKILDSSEWNIAAIDEKGNDGLGERQVIMKFGQRNKSCVVSPLIRGKSLRVLADESFTMII